MSMNKTNRLIAAALAGTIFLPSAQAFAQTPAKTGAAAVSDDESVDAVVVIGRRAAPGSDAPKSATCEFLVANDPLVRAQLALVATSGNAMMGPRIYLPTRPPRENDYAAAPRSAPGTPLPDMGQGWRGKRTSNAAPGTDASYEPVQVSTTGTLDDASSLSGVETIIPVTDGEATVGAADQFSIDQAVDLCRTNFIRGGPAPVSQTASLTKPPQVALSRAEIARRDKTLPSGFYLFDEGRYDEALDQFKQAYGKLRYEEGGDEAALMIGKIYLRALREKSDPKQAVTWLKRAADGPFNPVLSMPQFDPQAPENNTAAGEAAMMLAQIYLVGAPGIPREPALGRKYLQRANEVGHVAAAKLLGDIYYNGVDTPKDTKKAYALYKEAAGLGYAPAQFALGELYFSGQYGGPSNLKTAIAWYSEAAKLEEPNACYALAVAYDTGDGVAADPERAIALYKTAALKGHVAAMTALGTYFYEGGVVQKDPATARRWFEAAAKGGDRDAMFNLGAMMMKGEGGPEDRTHAWGWFKLAQARGKPEASGAIAVLERQMTAEEKGAAAKLLTPSAS